LERSLRSNEAQIRVYKFPLRTAQSEKWGQHLTYKERARIEGGPSCKKSEGK
jgi:hypothetical protein